MKHKTLLSTMLSVLLTTLLLQQPIHAQDDNASPARTLTGRMSRIERTAVGDGGSDYLPGTDITAQLRDDLVAGLDVHLPPGTFYVSESIIVEEYSGTIAGAGKDSTTIEVTQGFKATTDPFPLFTPDQTFTEIITIYLATGDVTFRDMTVLVTGDAPAEPHNNKWYPQSTTIDNVFWVGGVSPKAESEVTVTMENLSIKGEESSDPGSVNGKNLIYVLGIYGEVFTGYSADIPLNGVVQNCQIENAGGEAIEYWRVNGGSAVIRDNEISNVHEGIFVQQGINTLEITNNVFQDITTFPIRRGGGISSYCFTNNTLDGLPIADNCVGEFIPRSFEHDGYTRTYNLYVPAAYDGSEAWPLVISYHGYSWSPTNHAGLDGMSAVADTAHFLVAYPKGLPIYVGGHSTNVGWNVDGGFGAWDDYAFTSQLIDSIAAEYAVDLQRVHATGYSFGSMMAFGVACRLADRVASIAGVAGPLQEVFFADCPAGRPVSTLLIHGTADPVHPYSGYPLADDDFAPRPIPETPSFWARHNGCALDSLVTELPDVDPTDNSTVTHIAYPDCEAGTEVVLYRVNDGGHTWPGRPGQRSSNGTVNMDIDATAVIWDFFIDAAVNISTEERRGHVPVRFSLAQNYPNPFNPTTTITYTLPRLADVTLTVYDVLGRPVRVLASGTKPAGTYEVTFDASGLASGLYVYHLQAGDFVKTKRMVVVK